MKPGAANTTTCCIVGAGPAGATLAFLLARRNIPVLLLESQGDFDRDFRGDSLHPAILEVLAQIGLADELLMLPHTKIRTASLPTDPPLTVPFDSLPGRFPFITLMPQKQFLEFLTEKARQYPAFSLVMNATVRELIETDGKVDGVRYQTEDGIREVRAQLTIGADGRTSTIRKAAGLEAVTYGSAIDVLWLRLTRRSGDPEGVISGNANGLLMLAVDRGDRWQLGLIIPKQGYRDVRERGVEHLRGLISAGLPLLADRVDGLEDWQQVAMLSVRADRAKRWYRPGLLLIGDAAHVMSPVAGNGINYAIADAVATVNILGQALTERTVSTRDLAAVQRRRSWPTRITQFAVARAQNRLVSATTGERIEPPVFVRLGLRIPFLRRQAIRLAAYGVRPERLDEPEPAESGTSPARRTPR